MGSVTMLNEDVQAANKDVQEAYAEDRFNQSYSYFIERGKEKGLAIVIAHSSDYKDGKISNGWTVDKGIWQRTGELPVMFVYDKFPGKNDHSRGIKQDLQKRGIGIFNHPGLEALVNDKQKNYEFFSDLVPYAVSVNGSVETMVTAIQQMREVSLDPDLSTDSVVMKPKYGYGGKGLFLVEGDNFDRLDEIEDKDYVIQPFLESADGIPALGLKGRHDFRVIASNHGPKIAYVRLTQEGEFVSNETFGGGIEYFDISEVPSKFLDVVEDVDLRLTRFHPRVYSVDMARGKSSKIWVYEMNGKPGQVWNLNDLIDVEKTKRLQEIILDALVQGVSQQ